MSSPSIKNELQDFVQFATRRVEHGEGGESVEDLVQLWRNETEYAEAVEDVHQGLMDDADGRAEPIADAFATIRRQLGIAE